MIKKMKTKKTIYLAALAALAFTACSNDNNEIFDQSAAERLEQYKKDYANVLTENGGLWTMEYFSNEDEPGYLFVMKFEADGSVIISTNHKWIGDNFKEETSLWNMIADNGPVVSFNSYNNLFHIFSDPANITGLDAPKGEDDKDIDETGYGHNGDYEFQVMEVSEDHNTIRLVGKKRLLDIFLRRLDPSTDVKTYLDEYKAIESSLFCKEIPNILFKDSSGEKYVVTGAQSGILSMYPIDGDPVDQTSSSNFIITKSGLRFMKPFEFVNAAGEEKTISELKFVGNYSLADVDDDDAILSAGSFGDIISLNKKNFKIDMKSFDGSVKEAFDNFSNQLKSLYNYKSASINDLSFDYDSAKKSYLIRFYIRTGSKSYETDKYYVNFADVDDDVKLTFEEPCDNNSLLAYNAYSELQNIFNLLSSVPLKFTSNSDCGPKKITLSLSNGSLTMNAI